jgi:tetraacyldisaccharide 4'-kinase
LALKTHCPVVIAPKRTQAVRYLLNKHQCQIIISDDGLQHYRMGRAIELLVVDGLRGFGNGLCLPAGPLRESKKRLETVDFIIVNENAALKSSENSFMRTELKGVRKNVFSMFLKPGNLVNLATKNEVEIQSLPLPFAAVAAIGHPLRFYSTLDQLGIQYQAYFYPDHYQFKPSDLNYGQSLIIMTEKDAVKCVSFPTDTIYYLPVKAVLNDAFWNALWSHKQLLDYC